MNLNLSAEMAKYLADNYILGVVVITATLMLGYLVFCIWLVISARKLNIDICASAFIPVFNLNIVVRKIITKHRMKQQYTVDDEVVL